MSPDQLVNSIYLGDRGCKAIAIESWAKRVAVQVDVISRLRPGSSAWDFYAGADIENGFIVFTGVEAIRFDPSGPLPNDLINGFSVRRSDAGETALFDFELSISSVQANGQSTEVLVGIRARDVHLEDPQFPGKQITA